jgi:4-hydroxyphenylpyruvate dioxygenase-like putative hemolysin
MKNKNDMEIKEFFEKRLRQSKSHTKLIQANRIYVDEDIKVSKVFNKTITETFQGKFFFEFQMNLSFKFI